MKMNIKTVLRLFEHASVRRIAILLPIGRGEACIYHLESVSGWCRAYMSQSGGHPAGSTRRTLRVLSPEGHLYPDLIIAAASLSGISTESISSPLDPCQILVARGIGAGASV